MIMAMGKLATVQEAVGIDIQSEQRSHGENACAESKRHFPDLTIKRDHSP